MAVNEQRLATADVAFEVLEAADETDVGNRTFVFGDEGHTLGNALRHVLMRRKETHFCGYSIPHPSEPKMNMRLQTTDKEMPAIDLLKTGLQDLADVCDVVDEAFTDALQRFQAQ
uniref:DNA-directed RNA polymerases I and III subunit RPAC2 n=1 Tax=Pinguiococcus pyrenoidosus TaxID=172671 RepID=A0A7R9U1D2_9STRA